MTDFFRSVKISMYATVWQLASVLYGNEVGWTDVNNYEVCLVILTLMSLTSCPRTSSDQRGSRLAEYLSRKRYASQGPNVLLDYFPKLITRFQDMSILPRGARPQGSCKKKLSWFVDELVLGL